MPLAPRIAHQLRADGHDAIHLSEHALSRLPDEDVFAKAMAEGRMIVTADLDFGAIVARTGGRSVSVIVASAGQSPGGSSLDLAEAGAGRGRG
jgi:predicted nuclease of predicted toxin-antitoxin system